MNSTANNICEDWGWYVDTELNCYIDTNINIYHKNSLNKSYLIEENKYNNYEVNYKDDRILHFNENNDSEKELIYDIDSMTLIGCILLTLTVILFKSLN
jgi:hypothetical protein